MFCNNVKAYIKGYNVYIASKRVKRKLYSDFQPFPIFIS